MKLWTISKIAKALKVHESTVRRAIALLGLETHKVNGTPKLRHSVLVEWLGFDPSERVWTVDEVARWSGYSVPTIERSIRSGALQSVLPCPRIRRVTNSQLVAWLGFDPQIEDSYKPTARMRHETPHPDQRSLFELLPKGNQP